MTRVIAYCAVASLVLQLVAVLEATAQPVLEVLYIDDTPPTGQPDKPTDFSSINFIQAPDPEDENNIVGQIDMLAIQPFVNVNSGLTDIFDYRGETFRWSVDYFIPADTALEDGDDTFYLQVSIDANNFASVGFPAISAVAGTGWQTLELIGTIPTDAFDMRGLFVISDDGFASGTADTVGEAAAYIDNLTIEILDISAGDFDLDGDVDGQDFIVWQQDTSVGALADWQANYGGPPPALAAAAVPEPGAIMLAVAAGFSCVTLRRRVR